MRYLGKEFEHFSRQDRLTHYRRHAHFAHLIAPDEEGKVDPGKPEEGKRDFQHYCYMCGYECCECPKMWTLSSSDDSGRAELRIVGPLEEWLGFRPSQIIETIDAQPNLSHIHMVITSPGGYIELAQTLYSDLRRRARQGTRITSEGLALVASAALDLFLAGDEREVSDDTLLMQHPIHSFSFLGGAKSEIERQYDELMSQMDAYIALNFRIFKERTGQSDAVLQEWLIQPGEIWFSVDQAYEYGLLTQKPADYEDPSNNDDEAMQQRAERLQQQAAALIKAA